MDTKKILKIKTIFYGSAVVLSLSLVIGLTALIFSSGHTETTKDFGPTKGPIMATVVLVKDADSVSVLANPWPGDYKATTVRVYGVDSPEHGGRAKCEKERLLAKKAKEYAESTLIPGKTVILRNIDFDKYGDRMVAEIYLDDSLNTNYGQSLIQQGLAKEYYGGTKESWCQNK